MSTQAEKTQKTKEKGSVGNTIVNIILILFIVFAIIVSYTAYTTKAGSGVPSVFGIRPFAVRTDSMAPFFEAGDLVIDRLPDYEAIQVGDVITFWTVINGQKVLNTHRVVEVEDYENYRYFYTKGDNNPVADADGVHQRDVVGVYKTHIKGVGKVLDFLQTGKGFFICLVLPVAIFFVAELISFVKTLMAYNAEKVRLQIEQERAAELKAEQAKKAETAEDKEAVSEEKTE